MSSTESNMADESDGKVIIDNESEMDPVGSVADVTDVYVDKSES